MFILFNEAALLQGALALGMAFVSFLLFHFDRFLSLAAIAVLLVEGWLRYSKRANHRWWLVDPRCGGQILAIPLWCLATALGCIDLYSAQTGRPRELYIYNGTRQILQIRLGEAQEKIAPLKLKLMKFQQGGDPAMRLVVSDNAGKPVDAQNLHAGGTRFFYNANHRQQVVIVDWAGLYQWPPTSPKLFVDAKAKSVVDLPETGELLGPLDRLPTQQLTVTLEGHEVGLPVLRAELVPAGVPLDPGAIEAFVLAREGKVACPQPQPSRTPKKGRDLGREMARVSSPDHRLGVPSTRPPRRPSPAGPPSRELSEARAAQILARQDLDRLGIVKAHLESEKARWEGEKARLQAQNRHQKSAQRQPPPAQANQQIRKDAVAAVLARLNQKRAAAEQALALAQARAEATEALLVRLETQKARLDAELNELQSNKAKASSGSVSEALVAVREGADRLVRRQRARAEQRLKAALEAEADKKLEALALAQARAEATEALQLRLETQKARLEAERNELQGKKAKGSSGSVSEALAAVQDGADQLLRRQRAEAEQRLKAALEVEAEADRKLKEQSTDNPP